jgi:adenine phosphoribosyltransferase
MPASIEQLSQKILNNIIAKQSLLNNYPTQGVVFLAIDPLFNDSHTRKIVSDSVLAATKSLSFDCVAGIASRGYVFSGFVANQFNHKGEQFIQKVKVKGDPRFAQLKTTTEYSSDELQVLKGTVQKDKKYLLTDDLIASGGSALSSIQLIRDNGGQVNTVFVMTELVDLGARELLKKSGIELISLLKLTNEDLQKLLLLQEAYANNKTATISYQLSHHKGELTPECAVHIASQSACKKDGATLAIQKMLDPLSIVLIGHDVASGVSKQPFGYEETAKGASNRLAALRQEIKNSENTILVSVENGLRFAEDEDTYYDFVHVVIEKNNVISTHIQDCCVVPEEIIREIDPHHETTWSEIANRKGLAKSANNPHQEAIFGGISREVHIQQALNQALKKLDLPKNDSLTIQRVAKLNSHQSHKRYAQRGIIFSTSTERKPQNTIDLYNQGFPEKAKQNDFKIFDTGDAFSVISPEVELNGANVNIHAGVKHKNYSPLVLLHEALQICRCAHEHGAKEITIALPEQYHPMLCPSDFNVLLINLFKVSGAAKIYFYDQQYQGKLSENNKNLTWDKEPVLRYLQWNPQGTFDEKIAHHMRKHSVTRILSQCEMNQTNIDELMSHDTAPENIQVPTIKNPQHILLYCSANQAFAMEIAESLKARGETIKIYNVQGTGMDAMIPRDAKICGATVTIVQSTRPNPDNIELAREYQINGASSYFFEAISVARQAHLRGAEQINLVNPYQFGARSDKAENNTKGKTGAYIQHNGLLLEAAGVNHVVTAECHDPHTLSGTYTGKKIQGSAVRALTLISIKIAEQWLQSSPQGQFRLVTPDAGAAKRTKELTQTLQAILKKRLCESRILGEKERGSHKDDSALITNLNAGSIEINPQDKYLITDDETVTGSTLCQAIQNLKKQGAQDISVAIVHDNMPIDWLLRQLCLGRFLFLGVNDLHFSNTQEMGTLAKSYDDLIQTYSQMTSLSPIEIEAQVLEWFKKNMAEFASSFDLFKTTFNQISTRVILHNLSDAFVDELSLKAKAQLTPRSVYTANTLFSSSSQPSNLVDTNSQKSTLVQKMAM